MKRPAMLILIIVLIMFVPFSSTAQTCVSIQGVVTDATTGEALPGANIRSAGNSTFGTTTDGIGNFTIRVGVADTLLVTFIGYEPVRIAITDVENCFSAIYLQPLSKSMDEVTIQAERIIAEEFTIRKIRKLEIYTNPSAKADPILAVNSMPSATTTDESANISLRGGSPAETGVFLNNVPISDAVRYSQLNGIGTFSIFNTVIINNVQVFPGNPPLEYGNSTSGLIALQTEESVPENPYNSLSLTLANIGMYTSRKVSKKSSLSFFSNYQPSAAIRMLNPKTLRDLKSFSSVDAGVHYYLQLPGKGMIKIFNYSIRESYRFHYNTPTHEGLFHQQKIRNLTILNFRKRIKNTEFGFNQGINFSSANYHYSTLITDLTLKDLFSSFHVHRITETFEWKTGVTYDFKHSRYNGQFPVYSYAVGEQYPFVRATSDNFIRNPEWYGYMKKYAGQRWILGGGVRKNLNVDKDNNYLSYQGNIHYKPSDVWTMNASAGKYHKYQLPNAEADNMYLIRCYQYSLDINANVGKSEYSVSLFYKESETNTLTTFIWGIELFTHYRINSKLKFQLSVTSLDATQTAGEQTQPSPYNIHYFIRGNAEYKFKDTWTLNAVFLLRQGTYYYDVEHTRYDQALRVYEPIYVNTPARLPAYNIIDVTLTKIFPLSDKIVCVAFLSAGNVLNFKNTREFNYNFDYSQKQPALFSQRTIYTGIVFNF